MAEYSEAPTTETPEVTWRAIAVEVALFALTIAGISASITYALHADGSQAGPLGLSITGIGLVGMVILYAGDRAFEWCIEHIDLVSREIAESVTAFGLVACPASLVGGSLLWWFAEPIFIGWWAIGVGGGVIVAIGYYTNVTGIKSSE